MGRLNGKTAIVTGSGQGIGRGIALALAKEGASIVLAELNTSRAEAVQIEIEALGGKALAIACDVTNKADVEETVTATVSKYGAVNILVNNAQAFHSGSTIEETPDKEMEDVLKSGLFGSLWFMQTCFPHLKQKGGKVINIGSYAGITGLAGRLSYACTKEAIRALTRVAAREWGKYGINVNTICPFADSPSFRDPPAGREAQKLFEALLASMPISRVGRCEEDIGRAAVFLASSDSDYITGYSINVDGGMAIDAAR